MDIRVEVWRVSAIQSDDCGSSVDISGRGLRQTIRFRKGRQQRAEEDHDLWRWGDDLAVVGSRLQSWALQQRNVAATCEACPAVGNGGTRRVHRALRLATPEVHLAHCPPCRPRRSGAAFWHIVWTMNSTPAPQRTPLRRISQGSLFRLSRSGAFPDAPHGLGFLEPAMYELVDEAEALSTNVAGLKSLGDALSTFNESFASLLYVMNMNALTTDWPQASHACDISLRKFPINRFSNATGSYRSFLYPRGTEGQ